MVERLHLQAGDSLLAVETEDGILLISSDPRFERAWKAYEAGARKYRLALGSLAK
jgi:hypothetical protein